MLLANSALNRDVFGLSRPLRGKGCGGHANVNGDYTDGEQGLQRIVNSASARS
jgi:hypothetical protein